MILEQARAHFYRDKYAVELTGVVIDEVGHRCAKCHLDIDERHYAAHHHVMGGVVYTLADFAFAVAANAAHPITVSLNNQITFLKPPKGAKLIARAREISSGKTTCYYEVEVTDELETRIAHMTVTGYIRPAQ